MNEQIASEYMYTAKKRGKGKYRKEKKKKRDEKKKERGSIEPGEKIQSVR